MTDAGFMTSLALFIVAAIRSTAPLLLAAVGGAFSAQVNVFNIGLEGMMLSGAFVGFLVSDKSGSVLTGMAGAALSGTVVALIFAVAVIGFGADEVVVGITLNLAVIGLTATLLKLVYASQGSYQSPDAGQVRTFGDGWWTSVPFVGQVLRGVDVVMIGAVLVAVAAHVFLRRTRHGLRMRAIGFNREASAAAGISVRLYIYAALMAGGALAGVGGAYLSLSGLSLFSVDMAAGLGYIALAAVLFGNGKPLRVMVASVLFGSMTAAGFRLQDLDLPSEFVLATPYVTTILVLAVSAWIRQRRGLTPREAVLDREAATEQTGV